MDKVEHNTLCYTEHEMLILDDYTIEQTGKVHLDLTFEVHVTAEQAERTASEWAQDEITMHLIANTPTFVLFTSGLGHKAIWRVPLELMLHRHTYSVTTIDISATTGKIVNPNKTKEHVLHVLDEEVQPLAEHHPFTPLDVSEEYLSQFAPLPAAVAR